MNKIVCSNIASSSLNILEGVQVDNYRFSELSELYLYLCFVFFVGFFFIFFLLLLLLLLFMDF